jgi:Na+-transporting NADH:ubiquinone oxidoreductase subunit C
MRKGKIIVASMMVLCVLIFIAAAVWFMLFQQETPEPTGEEKQAAILQAAGLITSDAQDKKTLSALYHRYIIQRRVNLDSGELVAENTGASTTRQSCEMLPPERDPAQIRQRCADADIYVVKNKNNEIQQVIIPIFGKGAKSMMHAFLALALDGKTVKNLYYYQQRETPLLGARVEEESWRSQWAGKRLLDDSGKPALKIVQQLPEQTDEYTVDGISGATLTSTGVEKSINYWMGPQGYGPFLQRLARDPHILKP